MAKGEEQAKAKKKKEKISGGKRKSEAAPQSAGADSLGKSKGHVDDRKKKVKSSTASVASVLGSAAWNELNHENSVLGSPHHVEGSIHEEETKVPQNEEIPRKNKEYRRKMCKEIVEEYFTAAWKICAERFYQGNAPALVSLELRDTWLRILEMEWLDECQPQPLPPDMFKADDPPLPLAFDTWARGNLEITPSSRRESVIDPFLHDDLKGPTAEWELGLISGESPPPPPPELPAKPKKRSKPKGVVKRSKPKAATTTVENKNDEALIKEKKKAPPTSTKIVKGVKGSSKVEQEGKPLPSLIGGLKLRVELKAKKDNVPRKSGAIGHSGKGKSKKAKGEENEEKADVPKNSEELPLGQPPILEICGEGEELEGEFYEDGIFVPDIPYVCVKSPDVKLKPIYSLEVIKEPQSIPSSPTVSKDWSPSMCGGVNKSGIFRLPNETSSQAMERKLKREEEAHKAKQMKIDGYGQEIEGESYSEDWQRKANEEEYGEGEEEDDGYDGSNESEGWSVQSQKNRLKSLFHKEHAKTIVSRIDNPDHAGSDEMVQILAPHETPKFTPRDSSHIDGASRMEEFLQQQTSGKKLQLHYPTQTIPDGYGLEKVGKRRSSMLDMKDEIIKNRRNEVNQRFSRSHDNIRTIKFT